MDEHFRAQRAMPTCEEHEGEDMDTYCRSCDKRTCEVCCKKEHKDHDWTTTAKIVKQRKNERGEIVRDIRDNILPALKGEKSIDTQRDVARVREPEKRLIQYIQTYAASLVTMLVGEEGGDMTKDIEMLTRIANFFENRVQTATDNVVLEVDADYRRLKKHVTSEMSNQTRGKFVEGPFLPRTIKHIFGHVIASSGADDTTGSQDLSISDSKQFTCGTEYIQNIFADQNGTAWIHQNKSTKNLLIDSSGQVKNEIEVKTDPGDFIVLGNGDHVFAIFGYKEIRKVSPTGHVTAVCSTGSLFPTGISMSRDGHMLVSLCDGYARDITKDSRGEVHLMDMSGKVMRRYGADGRTKLWTNPRRVVQNVNLDMVVVDITDKEFRTKIIGVTVNGRTKFTYTGQADLQQRFSAKDIYCDEYANIMLCDYQNDCIHVLSGDGKFLQYLLTAQDGLEYPRSLALRDDTLWVGCDYGVVRVVKLNSNKK